ncbi:MAG: OmpA family protein [Polaromonas sp.]|nr:OmpA family protein [Polaromonas sp.]
MITSAPLKTTALALAVLLLAGCSAFGTASTAGSTGLFPQQARITDERILADRETLEGVQQRLRKLNEAGIPQNSYSLAKAQCWLDSAKMQYHENDRTGYIEEALSESVKIAQALEADKGSRAGFETPLIAGSSKLRDDLWAQLAGYKSNPASMACNARTVACAEVRLVRAGHADQQTGWRQATPHIQIAEDALRTAKIEADNCAQPRRPASAVATPMPGAAAAPAFSKETYVLLTDTLFRFDKSGVEDMIPGGRQRLNDVAQRLKAYASIQTLTVYGYTDRLGTDGYNDKLSEARAKSVQAYLASLGVKAATVVAQGKGKQNPVSASCSATASRAEQIVCLQPDRRVTIEVTGVAK